MSGVDDLTREIAIIKMARLIRDVEIAKATPKKAAKKAVKRAAPGQRRDGDGDRKVALYPGGPDIIPVRFLSLLRRLDVQPKRIGAEPSKGGKKAKKPLVAGKMPEKITAQTEAAMKRNPLFKPLFGPLPKDPVSGKGSFNDFYAHWRLRLIEQMAHPSFSSGGATHFRRFVPRGHKKGQVEVPNGDYVAGGPMTLNEVGAMGEMLMTHNPTIKAYIDRYFGAKVGESEGANLRHGRTSNSVFDAYAGGYGIEMKTTSITANAKGGTVVDGEKLKWTSHPSFKISSFRDKMKKAKDRNIKPALVLMVVDQQSGRVWIFAQKSGPKVDLKENNRFSELDMLTPGNGLYVGQDAMYSAWLYGSVPRPIREGGSGITVRGTGSKVNIAGKPSTRSFGSEYSIQDAIDAPQLGDFR